MKICVVGAGYVGLSLAVLISQKYEVVALDIVEEKVQRINKQEAPFADPDLEKYLRNKKLYLKATINKDEAYADSEFVVVATPTNYDINTKSFDTSAVEEVISDSLNFSPDSTIIIKSTVPIGFTDRMKSKHNNKNIFFSPEFLRESKALYDNLYPSRIVIGDSSEKAKKFGKILIECSNLSNKKIQLLIMNSKEAESVKLFSNTFLAMRVSFFNELDSFSEIQNLSSEKIIRAVSADPRIGNYYNNPSFGYGGYCLPKDTKQLLESYDEIPNKLIKAIIESNATRKRFIVNSILNKSPKPVGVYGLAMKKGSDNFRYSAIIDILEILKKNKVKIILYEPLLKKEIIEGIENTSDINYFKFESDLIIANRLSSDLENVKNKVYSRDIFEEN